MGSDERSKGGPGRAERCSPGTAADKRRGPRGRRRQNVVAAAVAEAGDAADEQCSKVASDGGEVPAPADDGGDDAA